MWLVGYLPASQGGFKARGHANSPGTFEYSVATDSGFSGFWMANSNPTSGVGQKGICYLTRVTGDFNGNGEDASITDQSATWSLDVKAGRDNYVRAKARCMAYDQWPGGA